MADKLLFVALTGSPPAWELWSSDATPGGAALLGDVAGPYDTVADGATAWFFGLDGDRYVLWSTDGTTQGTAVVDPLAATDGSGGTGLAAVDGALWFAADDGTHGRELWLARPGEAAARMVRDLLPGDAGSEPVAVGATPDGDLLFVAGAAGDRGLWRSDGTEAGTERLSAAGVAVTDQPGAWLDGRFHFAAADSVAGSELWATDGTAAGTTLAVDIVAGATGSAAGAPAFYDDALYFSANGGPEGEELWRFDGTTATLVSDILPSGLSSSPGGFAVLDGILYFAAIDAAAGRELWRSDGSADGTRRVADIAPGLNGSDPQSLVVVGDRLVFSADDGTTGRELWISDGTPEGTRLLVDLRTAASASPLDFAVLSGVDPGADTVPPDTFVATGPPPVDPSTSAGFVFASDEAGVAYETALDGGAWTASDGTATFAGLAPGSHRLLVRATDPAGNVDPTPAVYDWAVEGPSADTVPPDTSILSGPPATGAGTDASFVFASDEAQSAFEVALDGGPFLTVLNPLVMQGLAPGAHQLLVRAVDPSGNADPTPAAHAWFVGDDRQPPATAILSGPPAISAAAIAVLDLAADEAGARFEGRLDGGVWQEVGDPVLLVGLAAGAHLFEARAIDAAGNPDPTPVGWAWTVAPETVERDPGPAPVAGGASREVATHEEAAALVPEDAIDRLSSHASLRLPDGIANLTLLGAEERNGDGNDGANVLEGNGAANILAGFGGNDSILGMGGADFLAGGTGDDTVRGDDDAGAAGGDDTVWGGQGHDRILGGDGGDLLNGDRGADTILGDGGADTLNGGADGDRLEGGSGADLLRGGQGGDLLFGDDGNDVLAGDLGADTLLGGNGADRFVLGADGAIDVVSDFAPGTDRLQFAAELGIVDEATFQARAHDTGQSTILDLGAGSWAVLLGVRPQEIGIADLLIL
ncbi:ELWxxDGT repeat protein [Stella sp.]|uniref:ELWxxDGT repeat protein n=1 Tax=Stella sp. TaxID=2912054 RepID=UPI0035B20725